MKERPILMSAPMVRTILANADGLIDEIEVITRRMRYRLREE